MLYYSVFKNQKKYMVLMQKKPNFPERFQKESEYSETPC